MDHNNRTPPLTFRTYQILPHTNSYFHCLHSYLDLHSYLKYNCDDRSTTTITGVKLTHLQQLETVRYLSSSGNPPIDIEVSEVTISCSMNTYFADILDI